jgi:hypothetical protein
MGGVKGQQQDNRGRNVGLGRCRLTPISIAASTGDVPDSALKPKIHARFAIANKTVIYTAPIGDVANRALVPEKLARKLSYTAPFGDVANRAQPASSEARCDNGMGKRSAEKRPREQR